MKLLFIAVTACAMLGSNVLTAEEATKPAASITIPAGDLNAALKALVRQTGIQLLYDRGTVQGLRTKGVKAARTPQDAITQLLEGTTLTTKTDTSGAILIASEAASVSKSREISSASDENDKEMRLAWTDDGAGLAQTAQAPAAAEASGGDDRMAEIPEIIVTAQKRLERLQDVPAAVSSISGERLETLQVTSIAELANFIPGMSVSSEGMPGARQISIRGLNTGTSEISTPATVGTYIDNMPVGSSNGWGRGGQIGLDLMPFDIAAIEVLKGPQGTLYGANTIGGLVKYTLRKPNLNEVEARVGGELNSVAQSDEPGWAVRAALSVPVLVDELAVRVSGFHNDNAGYFDNATLGIKDTNSSVQKGGLMSVLWQPTERLTLNATVVAQDVDVRSRPDIFFVGTRPANETWTSNVKFMQPYAQETRAYNVGVDWDLGFATLTSSTGWSRLQTTQDFDISQLGFFCIPGLIPNSAGCPDYPFPDALAQLYNVFDVKKFVQEVRLASPQGRRFQGMVGAFYTDEKTFFSEYAPTFTPDYDPLPERNDIIKDHLDSSYEEKAIFVNATYELIDRWDVGGGVRYASLKQDQLGSPILGILNNGGVTRVVDSPRKDITTWMANVRFRASPEAMFYGRIATGYRPGAGCPACGIPELGVPGIVYPDRTTNYEVGFKGQFLDRRVQADVSAFYIDWTDVQINTFNEQQVNFAGNGGQAVSKGVELTTAVQAMEGLQLNATLAYTDAYLAEDAPGIAPGVNGRKGDQLPASARWTGSVSVDHSSPFSSSTSLLIGGSYRYRSRINSFSQTNLPPLPSQNIVDLYAGIRFNETTVRLFAKNAFDRYQFLRAYLPMQPRTVALSLEHSF